MIQEILTQHQNTIRLSVFLGVLCLMTALEILIPKKQRFVNKTKRWVTNLGLIIVDTIALRFLMPILAIGMAQIAEDKNWGLLSFSAFPVWLNIIIAIITLDALVYAQHVASHKIPIFWRIHKVHHVDRDLDVSSGFRFHPIEILLSMWFKFACIIALGAPAIAVFLFEVILNASAMFNHSNIRLPRSIDKALRQVIVIPDYTAYTTR